MWALGTQVVFTHPPQKKYNVSLLEACNWLAFQLGICLWERVPFKVHIRVHSTSQCLRLLLVCEQHIIKLVSPYMVIFHQKMGVSIDNRT